MAKSKKTKLDLMKVPKNTPFMARLEATYNHKKYEQELTVIRRNESIITHDTKLDVTKYFKEMIGK